MFIGVFACHQDVIEVYEQEIQILEDRVHEPLEGLCGVLEAKWHTEKLQKSERCNHCCLGHVLWVDWYLVIASD